MQQRVSIVAEDLNSELGVSFSVGESCGGNTDILNGSTYSKTIDLDTSFGGEDHAIENFMESSRQSYREFLIMNNLMKKKSSDGKLSLSKNKHGLCIIIPKNLVTQPTPMRSQTTKY